MSTDDELGDELKAGFTAPTEQQNALYEELIAALKKHELAGLTPIEILAIVANILGKIAACQAAPSALVMETLARNLKRGNEQLNEALAEESLETITPAGSA